MAYYTRETVISDHYVIIVQSEGKSDPNQRSSEITSTIQKLVSFRDTHRSVE